MAITDLNYASVAPAHHHESGTTSVCNHSRRSSIISAHQFENQNAANAGQCTVTELNFGFSVDMTSHSQPLRRMADIVARFDIFIYIHIFETYVKCVQYTFTIVT